MASSNEFTEYVKILARGKHASRDFTYDEAYKAMGLILQGKVEPEQLGALLMLLRVKEESPEEMAGFVKAIRENLLFNQQSLHTKLDIDWPTYAGKKKAASLVFTSLTYPSQPRTPHLLARP